MSIHSYADSFEATSSDENLSFADPDEPPPSGRYPAGIGSAAGALESWDPSTQGDGDERGEEEDDEQRWASADEGGAPEPDFSPGGRSRARVEELVGKYRPGPPTPERPGTAGSARAELEQLLVGGIGPGTTAMVVPLSYDSPAKSLLKPPSMQRRQQQQLQQQRQMPPPPAVERGAAGQGLDEDELASEASWQPVAERGAGVRYSPERPSALPRSPMAALPARDRRASPERKHSASPSPRRSPPRGGGGGGGGGGGSQAALERQADAAEQKLRNSRAETRELRLELSKGQDVTKELRKTVQSMAERHGAREKQWGAELQRTSLELGEAQRSNLEAMSGAAAVRQSNDSIVRKLEAKDSELLHAAAHEERSNMDFEEQMQRKERELNQVNSALRMAEAKVQSLEGESRVAARQATHENEERQKAVARAEDIQSKLDGREEQLKEMVSRLNRTESQISIIQNENERNRDEREKAERSAESMATSLAAAQRGGSALEDDIRERTAKHATDQATLKKLLSEFETMRRSLKSESQQLEQQQRRADYATADAQSASDDIQRLAQRSSELQAENDGLRRSLSELQASADETRAKYSRLERILSQQGGPGVPHGLSLPAPPQLAVPPPSIDGGGTAYGRPAGFGGVGKDGVAGMIGFGGARNAPAAAPLRNTTNTTSSTSASANANAMMSPRSLARVSSENPKLAAAKQAAEAAASGYVPSAAERPEFEKMVEFYQTYRSAYDEIKQDIDRSPPAKLMAMIGQEADRRQRSPAKQAWGGDDGTHDRIFSARGGTPSKPSESIGSSPKPQKPAAKNSVRERHIKDAYGGSAPFATDSSTGMLHSTGQGASGQAGSDTVQQLEARFTDLQLERNELEGEMSRLGKHAADRRRQWEIEGRLTTLHKEAGLTKQKLRQIHGFNG